MTRFVGVLVFGAAGAACARPATVPGADGHDDAVVAPGSAAHASFRCAARSRPARPSAGSRAAATPHPGRRCGEARRGIARPALAGAARGRSPRARDAGVRGRDARVDRARGVGNGYRSRSALRRRCDRRRDVRAERRSRRTRGDRRVRGPARRRGEGRRGRAAAAPIVKTLCARGRGPRRRAARWASTSTRATPTAARSRRSRPPAGCASPSRSSTRRTPHGSGPFSSSWALTGSWAPRATERPGAHRLVPRPRQRLLDVERAHRLLSSSRTNVTRGST